MIHKACMPVYMNSGKIVADGTGGRDGWRIEGSTRGPRTPKKMVQVVKIGGRGGGMCDLDNIQKNSTDFS